MTRARIDEIERRVFYRNIELISHYLEDCKDLDIVFHIGRMLGKMQSEFNEEMEKEVEDERTD